MSDNVLNSSALIIEWHKDNKWVSERGLAAAYFEGGSYRLIEISCSRIDCRDSVYFIYCDGLLISARSSAQAYPQKKNISDPDFFDWLKILIDKWIDYWTGPRIHWRKKEKNGSTN